MDPDLLTQIVRAGNDGVIPAPLAGEDMDVYKFRAACAGAVVATKWLEKQMAERAERQVAAVEQEIEAREMSGAGMGGGRPGDFTGTSPMTSPDGTALHPHRTSEEIDAILRRPVLDGAGTPRYSDGYNHRQDAHPDEIGVD